MKKYRICIIGCGARSRDYFKAYRQMPETEIVGCSDILRENAEKMSREFQVPYFDDPAKMLEETKPDVVSLVTGPQCRVELMNLVSEKGVPACIVEKPIACGVQDWRKLCELEERSRTKFAVSHQYRWQVNILKCYDALRSGKLGEVNFLDVSAGMNISGQGTHILNYARYLNREARVDTVFGAMSGMSDLASAHPAPDTTMGYVLFDNGVRGMWNNGSTAPVCSKDPGQHFWQNVRLAVYAERGRILWEEFGRWEIIGQDGLIDCGDYGSMDIWSERNVDSQICFQQAVLEWLEDDKKMVGTHLEGALHEWKTVLALYASALWHQPVKLAQFDPPDDLMEQVKHLLNSERQ
jgi:predicted dehydrogenase